MRNIDEAIGQALSDEDRRLLASPPEPGYLAQAVGLFRGPMAGVLWLVYVVGGIAFVAAAYAFWRMCGTLDAVDAVKWGVASLALLQINVLCKGFMGGRMEANRTLREIKRVELQIALLRDRGGATG